MTSYETPVRHAAVETAVFGAEAVLYDERSGMVHHLNASACAIWMLLDGRPLEDVVAALSPGTGVAPSQLRQDVTRAIAEFQAAGLLAQFRADPPPD